MTTGVKLLLLLKPPAAAVAAVAAPSGSFTLNAATYTLGDPILGTDTSTGSPTSWQWSWSTNSLGPFNNFVTQGTLQNPSLDSNELSQGTIYIQLIVLNAGGSSTSAPIAITITGA